jgi:2-aminoadipate transaminase
MQRSVLRDMIAVVSRPGILSLAGGLPAPELFPVEDYAAATAHVLASDPRALQYGPPFLPLKQHIVRLMAERGVTCTEAEIFITTGAQQGLDVLARLLLNNGGTVLYEETVYTGAQQVIAHLQPNILTIRTDLESGLDIDEVEAHLKRGNQPAFIYTIPDAHNPLGVSMSREKRERLVALAQEYNVPIIEDDPYGFLYYEQVPLPPIRALNASHVFYLGSFSKILAPALRLGWIVAPAALMTKLTVVKEACDLESSAFVQRTVSAYLDAGHLPDHVEKLRTAYKSRRDTLLGALDRHFPASARWSVPQSGMFVWAELSSDTDTSALLDTAVNDHQVAYIPGRAFAVGGHPRADHSMRLNFSNAAEPLIEEAVAKLGKLLS